MNWKTILKFRSLEDVPEEMYDDSYTYQNPDRIVSDLKKIYDENDLTHKNYKNGVILAGREGVDKSVFSMIMKLDPKFGAPMDGFAFMRAYGFKNF